MWFAVAATANVISWQAAMIGLAALVVCGVLRLLNEWQRRKTVTALTSGAPEGTVVMLTDSPDGHAVKASMGPRQPAARS
jgi:hypothetical protein